VGMQGEGKLIVLWVRVGIGLYSLFVHCLRAEVPFRCRWQFPWKKFLLDGPAHGQSFNPRSQWSP
jgi:hypothetical protein